MAGKKPESLSPRFDSIICPDIPGSFRFDWTFRANKTGDKQTKAVIRIYEDDSTTIFKTITVNGDDTYCDLDEILVSWEQAQKYEWSVTTYDSTNTASETSIRAGFYYTEEAPVDKIAWSSGPAAYENMGARTYFNTIATNLLEILTDYIIDSTAEQNMYNEIEEKLFVGDVVPSRSDFVLLEKAIKFLYDKEDIKGPEVDSIVENGLGAQDIHKVYDIVNDLLKVEPLPPTNIDISVPTISVPKMMNTTFASSGKEDQSVVVEWDSEEIEDKSVTIKVSGFSPSEDVWYYICEYRYGRDDAPYISRMYYRPEDFKRINNTIQAECRYADFITTSTMGKIHHGLSIKTVDYRGNESEKWYTETYKVADNYKTPLGLDRYEVEYQKASLKATGPDAKKSYVDLYNGDSKKATHKLSKNQEGTYFYRARYRDLSGQYSAWSVSSGNKFDPLDPPSAPKNLKGVPSYENITWTWSDTARADGYTWKLGSGGTEHSTPIEKAVTNDLTEGKEYTLYVRAYNKAGKSAWVSKKATTKKHPPVVVEKPPIKPKPITEKEKRTSIADCWRTGYKWRGKWRPAEWRTAKSDKAKDQIIQGMWIELKSGINTDGDWAPKGQTYGNHKSLIYLDTDYWTKTLQGKSILKVELYLKRLKTRHGYPNDGRYIQVWTHNYENRPSGEPKISNGTKINTNFKRGEGHWITLPDKFGELLRDGKIKGFALHANFRTVDKDKYTYCRFDEDSTKVRITYK